MNRFLIIACLIDMACFLFTVYAFSVDYTILAALVWGVAGYTIYCIGKADGAYTAVMYLRAQYDEIIKSEQ